MEIKSLVDPEGGLINRRIFADREIYEIERERLFARAQNLVPSREAALEGGEGAFGVGVARRLREDDFNQHVERVRGALVLRHAVGPLQVLYDVADGFVARRLFPLGRLTRRGRAHKNLCTVE